MTITRSGRRSARRAGLSWLAAGMLLAAAGACGREAHAERDTLHVAFDSSRADSVARARQDSTNRAQPGYVVDSIFPPDVALHRFRLAVGGDSATHFAGGSASREALVRRFVAAVANADTAELRRMVVHAREFADLYYTGSPYSHPPFQQPPDFAWRTMQDRSIAGLTKLLGRLGGKPMTLVSHRCDPKVARDGSVTRFQGCLVRVVQHGDTTTRRYFGSIVELGGQYKFLSYANDF